MHFADALTAATTARSPVCVGLDPVLSKLPDGLSSDAAGVLQFNRGIIDAVKDIAACIKPQSAYYELLGWEGIKVLFQTAEYAKEQGLIVILDAKRNDIGSTCEAYADAYLSPQSPFDALTVNAYLGSDGILPFIDRCRRHQKGLFILVKTSNPSAGELQDLPVGDEVLHEHLAQLVESWATGDLGPVTKLSSIGAVVGATYPEELKYLRTLMPHVPFLIPGYGAQGGTADDVRHGFIPDGTGAVVNASRSILFSSSGPDWQSAARRAAATMAAELQRVLRGTDIS